MTIRSPICWKYIELVRVQLGIQDNSRDDEIEQCYWMNLPILNAVFRLKIVPTTNSHI